MATDATSPDPTDLTLLARLSTAGRSSWAELGALVGLSAAAVADRVRRLEERGAIQGYAALLAPRSLGFDVLAFVALTLEHPRHRVTFLEKIADLAEVQECHHVVGDADYLLKVRCRDTAALEVLLSDSIKGIPGVARTHTTLALSSTKDTTTLPLAVPAPAKKGR